jgi:hypothetical protein
MLRKPLIFGPSLKVIKTNQVVEAKHMLKHHYLAKYVEKYKHQERNNQDQQLGENTNVKLKQSKRETISNIVVRYIKADSWKPGLPTAARILLTKFGWSDRDHSATQEFCGETTLYLLIKSKCLDKQSKLAVFVSHPLVTHMAKVSTALSTYDFMYVANDHRHSVGLADSHP